MMDAIWPTYIGKLCRVLHICKSYTCYKDVRRVYLGLVKLKKGGKHIHQTKSVMLNFLANILAYRFIWTGKTGTLVSSYF